MLADPEIGGYEVQILQDPRVQDARVAIDRFFSDAAPEDLRVLYFAGHGLKDLAGRLHLAVADSEVALLGSTAVSAAFVNDVMSECRAKQVVLLLDCCYSGAFHSGLTVRSAPTVDALGQFGGRHRVVITSSSAIEYAFEGTADPIATGGIMPGSVFTNTLVRGLRTGAADLDGDGVIDVDELYAYLYDEVRRVIPRQTPSRVSTISGQLVFARVPNSRVHALPEVSKQQKPPEPEPKPEPDADVDWTTDALAHDDSLHRDSLADVVAGRLREMRRDDPATFLVHVDGAWGTGKSSLLNFLDQRLAGEFTIVRFDAWRQSRLSPPWWALLSATRKAIVQDRGRLSRVWLRLRETAARARRSGAPYVLRCCSSSTTSTAARTPTWSNCSTPCKPWCARTCRPKRATRPPISSSPRTAPGSARATRPASGVRRLRVDARVSAGLSVPGQAVPAHRAGARADRARPVALPRPAPAHRSASGPRDAP